MLHAAKTVASFCALLILPFSIRSADVESDTLHGNTFQENATAGCDSGSCGLYLAATQHITTAVTAVSCSFGLQSGAQVLIAQLTAVPPLGGAAQDSSTFNLPLVYMGSDNGISYITITTAVQLFIKQGDYPYIYLNTGSSPPLFLTCTISGYHS